MMDTDVFDKEFIFMKGELLGTELRKHSVYHDFPYSMCEQIEKQFITMTDNIMKSRYEEKEIEIEVKVRSGDDEFNYPLGSWVFTFSRTKHHPNAEMYSEYRLDNIEKINY